MPAKNKAKIPSAEVKRRREQSMKDKTQNAARKKGYAANKGTRKQRGAIQSFNPKGALVKRVMDKSPNGSSTPFTLLAKSVVAPRDLPPMRFPGDVAHLTDTKHLWNVFNVPPIAKLVGMLTTSPQWTNTPLVFGKRLSYNSNVLVMFRNPVCPVAFFSTHSSSENTIYTWNLVGADAGVLNSDNKTMVYCPIKVAASPASPVVYTVPEDRRILAPSSCLLAVGGSALPGEPFFPGHVDSYGRNWHFYKGGMISMALWHTTNGVWSSVPPGGGVEATCILQRYNRTTDPEDVLEFVVSIPAGQQWGRMMLNAAGLPATNLTDPALQKKIAFFTPNVGYYRIIMESIKYLAPTAEFTYSCYATVNTTFAFTNNLNEDAGGLGYAPLYYLSTPVNDVCTQAPYMLENSRINASAMLLTNTTPALSRGGQVSGAKITYKPAGGDWYSLGYDALSGMAGHQTHGYRGALDKGAYTWMEIPDRHDHFNTYLAVASKVSGQAYMGSSAVATLPIDYNYGVHALWYEGPPVQSGTVPLEADSLAIGSTSTFMLRVDQHIEYHANTQFGTMKATPLKPQDLCDASMALVAAPLFTENWTHLNEIWGKIVRAGKVILTAGGKAMIGAAVKEMVAATAVMAL